MDSDIHTAGAQTAIPDNVSGSTSRQVSIVVSDVDGTVIRTDLLYESFLGAVKTDPLVLLRVPFWLMSGRAVLKRRLVDVFSLQVDHIPLREPVIEYLESRKKEGCKIVLASASDERLVRGIADRLGFVDEIIASDGKTNCKGAEKAAALIAKYGDEPWEYIGDSRADLPVWKRAARVVCVSSKPRLAATVLEQYPSATIIPAERLTMKVIFKALRVYQWMKNILVFVPLVLAHKMFQWEPWQGALTAALAFSLCASGVYLLNDLLDLEADRSHPRKRFRPCATGRLPLHYALLAAPLLFVSSLLVAWWAGPKFCLILGIYFLLTSAYSLRLKAIALVDIIVLAMLYTIRIVGGSVASDVVLSQWLLSLSMFFFLSLACVKRFSELLIVLSKRERHPKGRGYSVEDLEQIAIFGSAGGYMAVLVLALYISSKEVTELYHRPKAIWLACPLLLYWVSRTWLLARRGVIHDDPLIFALTDRVTYAVGALAVVIFAAAKWL